MNTRDTNISQLVWLYVKRRPFLREVLGDKIVNYSALSRKIAIEIGDIRQSNAVKMALIRAINKLEEKNINLEKKTLALLKKSSLTLRSKVSVIISSRPLAHLDYLFCSESRGIHTYVADENKANKFLKAKSTLRSEQNLNHITIHSPQAIENMPGVISQILGNLASEGINVVEFVSCYTDTLLVVKQADSARAHEILAGMMS